MSIGWKAIAVVGLALGAAVLVGVGPRLKQREALARVEKDLAAPKRVRVSAVRAGDAKVEVTLPGTSAPFRTSALYANGRQKICGSTNPSRSASLI